MSVKLLKIQKFIIAAILVVFTSTCHGFVLSRSTTFHTPSPTVTKISQTKQSKLLLPILKSSYEVLPNDLTTVDAISTSFSLDNPNVVVFAIGLIPFIWATVEFWRRIAVGASFGTGKDSVGIPRPEVFIGNDDGVSSRGRRTLGQGALIVAYILFSIAAGVIVLTLYSVLSSTTESPIVSEQLML
jgi:hypothetical protein